MSEEGEEEVPKVEEPPKPGLKYFVSNLNSFLGQSLVEELRNDNETLDPY
jgi:hypothetical protein